MSELTRRGFLRVAARVSGALAILPLYKEIDLLLPAMPVKHEWVEERESFYIVRVPDFKSFKGEKLLGKPTMFLLGENAQIENVEAQVANIYAPRAGRVENCKFDASQLLLKDPRCLIAVAGFSNVTLKCIECVFGPSVKGFVEARESSVVYDIEKSRGSFKLSSFHSKRSSDEPV